MDLAKFLIASLIFVFSALLFSPLSNAAMAYTGDLETLIHAFPAIFVMVCAVFPVYFLIEGKEK